MAAKTKLRIHSIDWDTDGENPDLPEEIVVSPDETGIEPPAAESERYGWSTQMADYLSDTYGWCVRSFRFEEVTPENLQAGLPKFLFLVDAPHPDGEDTHLPVIAADAPTARDLYVDAVLENGWLDEAEIAVVPIRVHQLHPLGAEYDAIPSRAVAWESVSETTFNPEGPEKEDPEP